jgi:hypothetical protein
MKLLSNTLLLAILSIILLYFVFKLGDYLASENYIVKVSRENFQTGPVQESTKTSHTVNLPLTTTYSCKNFCGPTARCAITGQQCFTDIDCPGCQPQTSKEKQTNEIIPGANDAGKLTVGVTPTYSSLTSGYGTNEKIITDNMFKFEPPKANFGVDVWSDSFNESQELFNKRYKPNQLEYMPNYPPMYSVTGEFLGDGPLPSNY